MISIPIVLLEESKRFNTSKKNNLDAIKNPPLIYLPVADLASDGLPVDSRLPTEDLAPRDVFFSRTICLLWFPMFKVPKVVRLILAHKLQQASSQLIL